MGDTTYQFRDASVPAVYDALFVPRFFVQFGEQLLSRAGLAVGDSMRALDVAFRRRLEAHLERGRVRAPMTSNVVTGRRPA